MIHSIPHSQPQVAFSSFLFLVHCKLFVYFHANIKVIIAMLRMEWLWHIIVISSHTISLEKSFFSFVFPASKISEKQYRSIRQIENTHDSQNIEFVGYCLSYDIDISIDLAKLREKRLIQ